MDRRSGPSSSLAARCCWPWSSRRRRRQAARTPTRSPGVVEQYGLLPPALVRPFAYALPVVELAAALGLAAAGDAARRRPRVLILLLLAFAAAMAINLARGRSDIDCGCFIGVQKQRISWPLVARNLVLAGFGLIAAGTPSRRGRWRALDWLTIVAAAARLLLLYEAIGRLFGLAPAACKAGGLSRWKPLVVSQIVLWIVVVVAGAHRAGAGPPDRRPARAGGAARRADHEDRGRGRPAGAAVRRHRPRRRGRCTSAARAPDGRSQLLLFVSPSCPMCKKLLPVARSFARSERRGRRDRADGRRRPAVARGDDRRAPAGGRAVRARADRRHQPRASAGCRTPC